MLYIFHVDTGATLTFDIKLALQSVDELKEAIERECGVLAVHQVLLMSGGECLEPQARVCSYSAGTDTNPIYLFSKAAIESQTPPTPHTDYSTDVDLVDQINTSLAMPATYATLVARAQLAQQCYAIAREQTRTCERLVHDQHLQQQGWAAVVANLEDITQMFQSRGDLLEQNFTQYLTERQQHMQLLNNFNTDLGTLSKIPILPALRAQAEGLLSPDDQPPEPSECSAEVLSLLRWISAKDNQSNLEQVAEQCSRGLEQFDERMMEALKNEVNSAIDASNKPEMKEIKGLGERLFALEQLMAQSKKLVQEQGELAQGFLQNQTRANNLGDPSVLPDLCASHRRQLVVMMENHSQLRDIRRRCTRAKEELSVNIYQRLKWIMYVENKMMEVDGKLVMYNENLKRLRRHLDVLQQIHLAPQMYLSAVAEVVRRRTFSQAFLVWASNLACQLLTAHREEISRRREFQNKFDGHFLNTLFPGLEDTPPPFATEAPTVFDSGLPKLTAEDMESLKVQLPDLVDSISTPDLNSITQFFLTKSLSETTGDNDNNKNKESITMPVDISTKEQSEQIPMTGDRVGFESETDTDEFEKIGQGVQDSKHTNSYDDTQKKLPIELEVGDDDDDDDDDKDNDKDATLNSRVVKLNHSISSSEQNNSYSHCPNPSTTITNERTLSLLSPLTELCENGCDSASLINYRVTNDYKSINNYRDIEERDEPSSCIPNNHFPTTLSTIKSVCDGQHFLLQQQQLQQQLQHQQQRHSRQSDSGDSGSPFADSGTNDFMGTEFYMDESLPSSLSEHEPSERQHQAIVSLLQENLGNTRAEVERLRNILRTIKTTMSKTILVFHEELSILREKVNSDKDDFTDITERVRQALVLHSNECERILREREQELTVDHELELADAKKMMQARDDEIRALKQTIIQKETEYSEQERLINSRLMRQKLENDQEEMRNLQTRYQNQLDEALDQARNEKELAVKQAHDARLTEITTLNNNLEQCRQTICELEKNLAATRADQQKLIKEASDKIQMEYKTELDTIRSRFKLMTASTVMERSPSDSSLEKIERPDMIELVNHEAILSQTKEDMEAEKNEAIRKAIEQETVEFEAKLQYGLQLATKQMAEELESQRVRESTLLAECQQYQEIIRRVTDEDRRGEQTLREKLDELEEEKRRLESKLTSERILLKQRENQIHELEIERNELRQELNDERMKMSQSSAGDSGGLVDTLKTILSSTKDDIEVSESKKVRLEASGDAEMVTRRLEILEIDNKRLNTELRAVRDDKNTMETRIEALEADKVRLEVELVRERSRRGFSTGGDCGIASSIESRDKDMNASVAVVTESSIQDCGGGSGTVCSTISELNRSQDATFRYREKLIKSTTNLLQQLPISLHSCNPGDSVVVLWDTVHSNYIILQESRTMYFLHSECVDTLELRPGSDGLPKQTYVFGEVIDKQYCHAKKPENRYHVPQGTKFYRVRIKPVQRDSDLITSTSEKSQP